MARRRFKGPKDPFADLDEDFKDAIQQAKTDDEIRRRMAKVAAAEEENQKNKKEDQQLKEARQAAKDAGAQYTEATKMNRLRIRWCMRVLSDRGKEP